MNEGIIEIRPAQAMEMPQSLGALYDWKFAVVYALVILLLFWLLDEKRALRFGVLLILSLWINAFMSASGAPWGQAQPALYFWIPIAVWFVCGPLIEKYLAMGGIRFQNIAVALTALAMNGLYPQERAFPALFLGFCLGYTMMKQRFPFAAQGEINGKKPAPQILFVRCFIGLAGSALIFLLLGMILPGEGSILRDIPNWDQSSPFYDIGRFARFGLLGFWASAGAPRFFQRVGAAGNPA